MFNTIDDALNWLFVQKQDKKRENLDRISNAINLLNLVPDYKIIHIAGTNGKGSFANFIKNILKNTNKHVGIFISPFVISFNERIGINDRKISDSEIIHYLNILYPFSINYKSEYNETISFFELTLLMALMYFKDRKIDYLVLECGMGGLLDATNALKSDYQVITNIGFDHMQTLGNDLISIANHKLGILENNSISITSVDESLKSYFLDYAKSKNNNMIYINNDVSDIKVSDYTYFKYKNIEYKTNLLGTYQAYNASLAIALAYIIEPNIPKCLIDFALENTFHPGRMEIIKQNPTIILDGAHNIHGVDALVESIKQSINNKKIHVIFTALHDKNYQDMIKKLDEITTDYVFTTIDDVRATNPADFENLTNKPYIIYNDYKLGIDYLINNIDKSDIILITGSLHFISTVRNYLS